MGSASLWIFIRDMVYNVVRLNKSLVELSTSNGSYKMALVAVVHPEILSLEL